MSDKETSLPSVLPYRSFLPDGILDLRGNGITIGYQLSGPSPEVSDLADLVARSRQLAGAMVHLGTGDILQVIYNRLPAPEPPKRQFEHKAAELVDMERRAQFTAENHWLTPTNLYLTHAFDPPGRSWIRSMVFATNGPQRQTRNELLREYALNRFQAFEDAATGAIGLRRLSAVETFRDLLLDVTYHDYPAALPDPHVRLNDVVGCEHYVCGFRPYVNGYHLRPICITAYPAMTVPQILATLLRQPGRMTICARFICRDPYDAKRDLEEEKKHWNREILGSVWRVMKGWISSKQKIDHNANAQIADIEAAITASAAGLAFGWGTVTAIVRDEDPDRADLRANDIRKECHSLGMMCRIEDLHAMDAIESTWPGNGTSNIERTLISGGNYADLVLPAHHWLGTPYIDSSFYPDNTPTPLVCGGAGSRAPFYYPTHVGGVANQLIVGPSGSGKSSLIAAMVAAYLGIPDARIAWLDLDYSSFVLAHLLNADYRDVGGDDTPPLCPLAVLDQPSGLEWLFDWFSRLFTRWQLTLNEVQAADLTRALEQAQQHGFRKLTLFASMLQDQRMRTILQQYAEGGKWAHIFAGEVPPADVRLAIYELRNLISLGDRAYAPAIELVLHSITSNLSGNPAWVFADEFWALLADPISSEWLFNTIRTLRKKNAGFVGCTQSLVEIASSPYRDLLLESCPGKILLPNSEARGDYVREAYYKIGLNSHEIDLIATATPKRQYYFHSRLGTRLFNLNLGPVAQAICASTGLPDVETARRLLEESDEHSFLNNWLEERDIHLNLPLVQE